MMIQSLQSETKKITSAIISDFLLVTKYTLNKYFLSEPTFIQQ